VHGAAKLLAWWIPSFDTNRFDAKLYAVKNPDVSTRTLEEDGLQIAYMGQSAFSPSTLPTFLRVIRQENADIVHLHGWIAANFGRIAGRIAGVPTVMHEHGVDPNFPAVQRNVDRLLSRFTHTAVAVSSSVRDFLINKRFVDPAKIRVIYNGTPLEKFALPERAIVDRAKADLGIPAGSRVVGTVGRLDTQKGITYLLHAARRVKEACPDVYFLIVGDGPLRAQYEAEARDLGLAESVIFTGHRSDLPALLSMFDVQVFPSLWEGLPLTLIESMASGRPIVSTNVDGLGEALTDGKNAVVVPPAAWEPLAEGTIRLLTDRELAHRLGENAFTRSKDFDNRITVKKLEDLYEELCSGRKRGR
jgi:glycosyltransferase involved in cell wall biosynthesis